MLRRRWLRALSLMTVVVGAVFTSALPAQATIELGSLQTFDMPAGVFSRGTGVGITSDDSHLLSASFNRNLLYRFDLGSSTFFGTAASVRANPYALTITPDDSVAIVSSVGSSGLTFVDIDTMTVTHDVAFGTGFQGVATDGTRVFVADSGAGTLEEFNLSGVHTRTYAVGSFPQSVAIDSVHH